MKTYKFPFTHGVASLLEHQNRLSEQELTHRLKQIYLIYRLNLDVGAKLPSERKALEGIATHLKVIHAESDEDEILRAAKKLAKAHEYYTREFGGHRVYMGKIVSEAQQRYICHEGNLKYLNDVIAGLPDEGRGDKSRNILTEQLMALYTDVSGLEPVVDKEMNDKKTYKPALNFIHHALTRLELGDIYPSKRALEKQISRLYP